MGTLADSCLNRESSLWRIGRFSYSAADERISIRPFNLVLLLRDMLNSSGESKSGVRAGEGEEMERTKEKGHVKGCHYCQVLTNGGVVDVVVGSNHSKVEGREVHLILNSHTLGRAKRKGGDGERGWGEGMERREGKRVRALC